MRTVTILIGLLVVLPGCSAFRVVGGAVEHRRTHVSADLPAGWYVESLDPAFTASRNGPRLQQISASVVPLEAPLTGTQRRYPAGMLPNEVAELALGLIEASPGHANFETLDIAYDEIAGSDGFAANVQFVDSQGLPKRMRVHGVVILGHVFQFIYEAAAAVYYDMDEPAFDAFVGSVRVAP